MQNLKIGNKTKMRIPGGQIGSTLCHIEAIIVDPVEKADECNMIVYRYWSKYRQHWIWKVHPYWHLAMYNDWECEILK